MRLFLVRCNDRSSLDAWRSALLYDVLMVSDDEMAEDEARCDYGK